MSFSIIVVSFSRVVKCVGVDTNAAFWAYTHFDVFHALIRSQIINRIFEFFILYIIIFLWVFCSFVMFVTFKSCQFCNTCL